MTRGRRLALQILLGGVAAFAFRVPARAETPDTYTYDVLGRLTSVTYANGDTVHYVYDSAGNRTEVQLNGTPPPPPPPPPPPVPGPLSVGISATEWFSGGTAEDQPIAVLVSGGVPPYKWAWERVTGVPALLANTPTASWTTWAYTGSALIPPLKIATWRCLVTDAASTSAYTPNVEVTIYVS